ncbi:MAG: DUF4252 domain-containing protein [Prevotella sp.]|nr:DUF4252 domain-containing protein [Prevotella sp.]
MKKIIFMLALMLSAATNLSAQTADDIFDAFKDKPNVQFVNLPKAMMNLASNAVEDNDKKELMKKMDSMRIMNIEEDEQLLKEFSEKVQKLSKKDYEQMVNSNEDGEKTLVLVKTKNDSIKEMLVIHIESDEGAMVQICGDIRPEDVKKLQDIGN